MPNSLRPEEKVVKMLRRLPPDAADEVSEELVEYIEAWESDFRRKARNTEKSRSRSLYSRIAVEVQKSEPLFSGEKPWH